MTVADDHLARIGAEFDALDDDAVSEVDEHLPECVREASAPDRALQPIVMVTIRLGAGPAPGVNADEDASLAASVALARRDVLAQQAAGVDHGLAADNLRLLDRIDELIGTWPNDSWDDAVRSQVQDLVDARKRGALRGKELRRNHRVIEADDDLTVGWLLRHPADHWLRRAALTISDPGCLALIDAQLAKLEPGYRELSGMDLAREEATAEIICEIEVLNVAWTGWKDPARATVTAPIKGNASLDQHVALRLVEDPDAQFNGTLVDLLAGERWCVCARELRDGTLLPLDGTRRRSVPSP